MTSGSSSSIFANIALRPPTIFRSGTSTIHNVGQQYRSVLPAPSTGPDPVYHQSSEDDLLSNAEDSPELGDRRYPNRCYYPPHVRREFRKLTQDEQDERERVGLNSISTDVTIAQENLIRRHPWKRLLKAAILGSSKQSLTLSEIRYALEVRFPFMEAKIRDGNAIRHTLSLYKEFNLKHRRWSYTPQPELTKLKQNASAERKNLKATSKKLTLNEWSFLDIPSIKSPVPQKPVGGNGAPAKLPSFHELVATIELWRRQGYDGPFVRL